MYKVQKGTFLGKRGHIMWGSYHVKVWTTRASCFYEHGGMNPTHLTMSPNVVYSTPIAVNWIYVLIWTTAQTTHIKRCQLWLKEIAMDIFFFCSLPTIYRSIKTIADSLTDHDSNRQSLALRGWFFLSAFLRDLHHSLMGLWWHNIPFN